MLGVMRPLYGAIGGFVILAIGVLVGVEIEVHSSEKARPTSEAYARSPAKAIQLDTAALVRLRSQDFADAALVLESAIDGNLVILNVSPTTNSDEDIQRVLKRTAEYRARYPHKSGEAGIDGDVENILSHAASNSK